MVGESEADRGWFVDADTDEELVSAIRHGSAESPRPWPDHAVDAEFARNREAYVERLRTCAIRAASTAIDERATAGDETIKHLIRSMDELEEMSNELAERVGNWAHARGLIRDRSREAILDLRNDSPSDPQDRRIVSMAALVNALEEERDELRTALDQSMQEVAPNLHALAGPELGARLIAEAGDLQSLSRMPSGTVQVLGAEDALFAHLSGNAPSPKHGYIFTHEAVRETDPSERGSAARALAGKLAIAARIDHYTGERRPELEHELDDRIARIRGR